MRRVLRAGALGRPRGMGWRGRRDGGWGWGTHVNPCLIHVNVWQKPLQYCKVISLQLIKINGKKNLKKKKKSEMGQNQSVGRAAFPFVFGYKKWQSIPVFLPGESHGQRSLVGCSSRGHKESDITKRLRNTHIM